MTFEVFLERESLAQIHISEKIKELEQDLYDLLNTKSRMDSYLCIGTIQKFIGTKKQSRSNRI